MLTRHAPLCVRRAAGSRGARRGSAGRPRLRGMVLVPRRGEYTPARAGRGSSAAPVRCLLRQSPGSPSRCRVRLPEATPLCLKRSSARLGVSGSPALTLPLRRGRPGHSRTVAGNTSPEDGSWEAAQDGDARPRTSREPRCPGRAAAQSQGPRPVSFMPCGHAPGARHMLSQRPGWWRGPPRTAGPPCG